MKFNRPNRWYIVANRSQATIYEESETRLFEVVTRLYNPDARLSEGELDSDRAGRALGKGPGQHTYDRSFHHHEQVGVEFARKLVQYVEHADSEKRFEELVLVAGPSFVGYLRNLFSNQILKKVTDEVVREFVHHSDAEVRTLIHNAMKVSQRRQERSYENRPIA
jgi:protein required for attachment to host cells